MAEDSTLTCGDCGAEFTFTAGEAEFYEEKGFTPPKRCPDCRQNKKDQRRTETEVTCAGCGTQTTVPFVPTSDKPVYCRDCFDKQKNGEAPAAPAAEAPAEEAAAPEAPAEEAAPAADEGGEEKKED